MPRAGKARLWRPLGPHEPRERQERSSCGSFPNPAPLAPGAVAAIRTVVFRRGVAVLASVRPLTVGAAILFAVPAFVGAIYALVRWQRQGWDLNPQLPRGKSAMAPVRRALAAGACACRRASPVLIALAVSAALVLASVLALTPEAFG